MANRRTATSGASKSGSQSRQLRELTATFLRISIAGAATRKSASAAHCKSRLIALASAGAGKAPKACKAVARTTGGYDGSVRAQNSELPRESPTAANSRKRAASDANDSF